MNKEKELIFEKIEALDNVIHIMTATANKYYSPDDKMWDILLKAKESLEKHIEKEKKRLYSNIRK